jgi:hypothetical protein
VDVETGSLDGRDISAPVSGNTRSGSIKFAKLSQHKFTGAQKR